LSLKALHDADAGLNKAGGRVYFFIFLFFIFLFFFIYSCLPSCLSSRTRLASRRCTTQTQVSTAGGRI
jgi:hypothetical protein